MALSKFALRMCMRCVNLPYSHVFSNFLFTGPFFEIFSRPFYKTDDTLAYFVDQWEWMQSLNFGKPIEY